MASPERLVSFDYEDTTYRLVFTNAARAVAENELNQEWPEIGAKIDAVGIGPRLQAALLFGATRKYHRRELPNMPSVYNLLDGLEDAGEEAQVEFMAALLAAFYGVDKQVWLDILNGVEDEPEDEAPDPKAADATPPKKKSTKAANSDSETGTAS